MPESEDGLSLLGAFWSRKNNNCGNHPEKGAAYISSGFHLLKKMN